MRIAQIIAAASSVALVCAIGCSSIPSGNVLGPADCSPTCASGEVCVVKADNDAGSASAQPHCEPDEGCGSCDCLITKKCSYSDYPTINHCARTSSGEVQLYCGYV